MKTSKRSNSVRTHLSRLALGLAMAGGLVACGNDSPLPKRGMEDQETVARAQDTVNQYVQALAANDETAIRALMSTEISERLASFEGGIKRFMEKQRRAILNSVPGMSMSGEPTNLEVVKVSKQEGLLAVTLKHGTQTLERPLYFVAEGDTFKLNLARPGFSKPLPDGALAADNYKVVSSYGAGGIIACANDYKWMTLTGGWDPDPAHDSGHWNAQYIRCANKCGFFSGADMSGAFPDGQSKCDYNTWGADVINTPEFGLRCNDRC